jgi:hypothetical protein
MRCGMEKRESWNVDLRCPTCGTAGEASVSAEDNDYFPQLAGTLRVDRMPDGFRVRKLGQTMRATQFECIACSGPTAR